MGHGALPSGCVARALPGLSPPGAGSGQLDPRHIEAIADRCYLPVLAEFATLDCAGTGRQRQATRRRVPGLRGPMPIALGEEEMVEMTGIEPVTSSLRTRRSPN